MHNIFIILFLIHLVGRFLLIIFILDIFLISLAISRYGRFKLGSDDEEPEFSFLSWLGMLFSTGLGVGIVFWGVL